MALINLLPQNNQRLVEKFHRIVEVQMLGFIVEDKLELKLSKLFSLILTIANAERGD